MAQIVNTKHGKMEISLPNDYISKQLLQHGEYEWYVIDILKQLSGNYTNGTILDIGGNQGTVTLSMAKLFPHYHIHTFEIQPVMLEIITQNLALNNLKNVTVHATGLGNVAKTISVAQPDYNTSENAGAFSLNPMVWSHSDMSVGHGSTIEVELVTLDSLTFDAPIRCIKLDVEGYEQLVLEGAVDTLKEHNYPPIVYELWGYNPWWNDCAEQLRLMLTKLGYQIQRIDDTGIAIHP